MKMLSLLFINLFTFSVFAADIVFGVVPQQSPSILIEKWMPVVNYLSKETGLHIILNVEKSIPEFEKKLNNGVYDMAYMNPYHYVIASKKQGYKAFIRDSKMIVGILVSCKNIKMNSVNLRKMKYLFPAPFAFAATILTKYEINEKYGVDIDKNCSLTYVNSHDSVYKGVARGVGDIGGGIERTFNNLEDKKTKEKLQIIYRTAPYPSHPIAFHPRVDKKQTELLKAAILSMPVNILNDLSMKKLIEIDDSQYNVIRKLAKNLDSKE
ncbi:phosphate/phosphite/phosphonate ABC transporter substrate-binding protein [Sulfurimonas sp.]|uniref:phosphate/phosphite/phosphonate ABC transporter substrate-binding protein n=1 Tax=Sulfurimonas sp. TaxID=2022749 RepID=UPI00356A117D